MCGTNYARVEEKSRQKEKEMKGNAREIALQESRLLDVLDGDDALRGD